MVTRAEIEADRALPPAERRYPQLAGDYDAVGVALLLWQERERGPMTPGGIGDLLQHPKRKVVAALARLSNAGIVRRHGGSKFELTDDGRVMMETHTAAPEDDVSMIRKGNP